MLQNTSSDNATATTPLIEEEINREEGGCIWWKKVLDLEEAKTQVLFSLPMILTNVFYYAIPLVSVMFSGHLGHLELAGATLANSWAAITGFALMTGISGALETLCGQGFGAKEYRMLGIYLQASCIISLLFSIVVSICWFYTETILVLLHQDPTVSKTAALYMRYLIPGLFAYGFIQNFLRFLQTQSIVVPLVFLSALPTALHFGIAYALVHWTSLGFKGAPLAVSVSLWISMIFLAVYVICSKKFEPTWQGFSFESFSFILATLKLALPSAAMVCLEYWAFEILVLLAGLMPNSELTTSLVAMCVNTQVIAFMITYGLSAAVSTRVSNDFGAGSIDRAKSATAVTLKLSVLLVLIVVLTLAFGHNIWVGFFSDSREIIMEFATLTPFLATSIAFDSAQGVLSGVARGGGWQHLGMYANLATFYFLGMPIAGLLGFKFNLHDRGLWIGLICGLFAQTSTLLLITFCRNWTKMDIPAVNRENETQTETEEEIGGWWRKVLVLDVEEAKNQVLFSLPMILTNVFYYAIPLVSVMFAGHLGHLQLAGATLANSWATVTGFAFMTGLSGSLETLCGQGFGAKEYRMLGIYLQASCIISFLFSIVVSICWFYTEPILILLQQDPDISKTAALYMRYLIPGLFAYGFIQNILRFLQTQSIVLPLVFLSALPMALHFGIVYALVHWTSLGFKGAPLAVSVSLWISILLLVVYLFRSNKFEHTWHGFSYESFSYILANLKIALPSAAMVCLEYWAFEILVFLAGLMSNAELTTSLIAMCVNTEMIAYMITYGLSAAASTRVSNLLGSGNHGRGKSAMLVTLKLSVLLALTFVLALAFGHNIWAGFFSDSVEIIEKFASLTPLLAISVTFDSVQGVLSGLYGPTFLQ
ncbi:hypothetical protein Dsin_021961 [Dipteronia sinensis]|uniref:Protein DETOXIFICATION n=1 Tax=Dipteronia sinensis TaxID=43782 RepID=A0AAE0A236_9ROSI|nr:hypothetical protein Dsin_021961 [Dipteronia sinensis]